MKGLPKAVKSALQKARDSALLAVEVYNKPAVAFKSGAYITLMIIAWTALFHAIFFRRGVKPYYRRDENKPKSRYVKVDGDYKHWELRECLKRYYGQDTGNPVRRNLEFFIVLRNKIEHRSMPEIDPNIFGECQAMLLNFDEMLEKEFGARYCLRQSLSFALQMFPSPKNLAEAIKRNRNAQEVVQFVEQYRSTLSAEVLQSGQFSFKAFLIQVANHESKDALPIQFIHWDQLTEDQKKQLQAFAVMVKHKHVPVANLNTLSPSEVVKRVRDGLAKLGKAHEKLNLTWRTRCWQHYRVRPSKDSMNPEQTDTKYCIHDARHKDYGYTEEWVKFLIEEFKDDSKYEAIFAKRRGEHQ